ncbi:IS3 family transposase [Paraburkholderia bannensis]|uniref:IS3 family transposase n=1 Tax=Paraburkholderia bannensis TaxID=765414 RepID=UPI0038BCD168
MLLTSKIRSIHVASRHTYGAPRVHAEQCAQEFACCLNTVAKLMRQAQSCRKLSGGIASPLPEHQKGLTRSGEAQLLGRSAERLLAERHHLHPYA